MPADQSLLNRPRRRWGRRIGLAVAGAGLLVGVTAVAGALNSAPSTPTARQLEAACLPNFRRSFADLRVPSAQIQPLLAQGSVAHPVVAVEAVRQGDGFFCLDGTYLGPFDLSGFASERPSKGQTADVFHIMFPLLLGNTCTARSWAVFARAPVGVTLVVAVSNTEQVRVRPSHRLIALVLHEHFTGRPVGDTPFGELLGFGSHGQVLATANLLQDRVGVPPSPHNCPT